jgi:hypothetical protein
VVHHSRFLYFLFSCMLPHDHRLLLSCFSICPGSFLLVLLASIDVRVLSSMLFTSCTSTSSSDVHSGHCKIHGSKGPASSGTLACLPMGYVGPTYKDAAVTQTVCSSHVSPVPSPVASNTCFTFFRNMSYLLSLLPAYLLCLVTLVCSCSPQEVVSQSMQLSLFPFQLLTNMVCDAVSLP